MDSNLQARVRKNSTRLKEITDGGFKLVSGTRVRTASSIMPDFKRDLIRSSVADRERPREEMEDGSAMFRTLEGERPVARPRRIPVLRYVTSMGFGGRLEKKTTVSAPGF